MRVLLTNDDGIEADGLQTLRRALLAAPGVDLRVVAPDGNRSAMARMITTRRPLWVQEHDFGDGGASGFATDGTPVDCVRLAHLGLVDGWYPEMVVSGINHGTNIGDDITYSGTVAAALEAIILGLPGIAVSQQSNALELDFRQTTAFDFEPAANFTARLVGVIERTPLPESTLLNINFPGCAAEGVRVARLGRRFYRDELELIESDSQHPNRHLYRVYGEEATGDENERDTDIVALESRQVALTPLHFDLTHHDGLPGLVERDLAQLLEQP